VTWTNSTTNDSSTVQGLLEMVHDNKNKTRCFPSNTPTNRILHKHHQSLSGQFAFRVSCCCLWCSSQPPARDHAFVFPRRPCPPPLAHSIFHLKDVLDHVFEQGFVDPKLCSVVWWEDCTSVRLEASSTVQDLLVCGAGSTPETAL
jgi:hypothetical protein